MNFLRLFASWLIIVTSFYFLACKKKIKGPKIDAALASLVSGFSSGPISANGPIRIVMVNAVADSNMINKELHKETFDFSPSIKGIALWVDERTLEFRPAEKLKRGKNYHVVVHLDKVVPVPEKLKALEFDIVGMEQYFENKIGSLELVDENHLELQRLSGIALLADAEEGQIVEEILSVNQEGQNLKITWEHKTDGREHVFHIDNLKRGEAESKVVLHWNGKSIQADKELADTIRIPSINEFSVLSVEAGQGSERYILVHLSDPPKKSMDFRGLVEVSDQGGLRFQAIGNEIRVYSSNEWSGSKNVQINAGLYNVFGKPLQNPGTFQINFEEIKPGIRFIGKGVILPGSSDLTLPFEAVNLRAVHVTVTRIFSGNIPQFLQVNDLEGENELQRVGRVVWNKTLHLNPTTSMSQRWARYALDLTEIVKKEDQAGSMYRISLSFDRSNSLYPCADSAAANTQENSVQNWDEDQEAQASGWDGVEEYYDDNEGYRWEDRENPCTPSYYRYGQKKAARNFLASNIGLMAKTGMPGHLFIVATDLLTAKPLGNTEIEVLNYQHQVMAHTQTDGDGFAEVELTGKPFLIKAIKEKQQGYLKVDERTAIQMGQFEVGGLAVQEGLKGFLFGERGVWRPGDSLYLTFILEDKQGRLPSGHPLTFELRDPQGRVVRTLTREASGSFYSFATNTDIDAPTGNYLARIHAGPAIFEEKVNIENVMPNRLKIRADFSPKPLRKNLPIKGNLDVSWLSGAVAKYLEAEVEMTLENAAPNFPIFTDYTFEDPLRNFQTESQNLFQGRIDGSGKASFSHTVKVSGKAPGFLQANFRTRVLEAGGGFSIDRYSQPFYPYNAYVGMKLPSGDKARNMLLTDTTHNIRFCMLDTKGQKISHRRLQIHLFKMEWKWWWQKDQESANYISSESRNALQTDTVRIAGGEGTWSLKVKYPEWGRYLIRACDMDDGAEAHCTGKVFYMDWPGWAGRAQREGPGGGAAILSFTSDKAKYNVGEKVRMNIPSPKAGNALITIEKGGHILKHYWIPLKEKETIHEFEATADMAPNAYVYAALLQPHQQTQNDLPIRMYNVVPIQVEDPNTHLQPLINVEPNIFRPGEKAKIKVSEAAGKTMQYVVAVVDEGLLDLTRFKTPNPWERFYAREALSVKTWDLYDFVAGAYGGKLERLLSIGGDENIKPANGHKGNRFPPMVRFIGPFTLGKGKSAQHEIDIPQYVGSVRVMVIAGQEGAYGYAEKAVPVRKPLMVLGTLPRILVSDEKVSLPISVFALEKNIHNVNVEVTVSGPLKLLGESHKKITFNEPSDELVTFDLQSLAAIGWAKVTITANSGGENAKQVIEIEVRNPNLRVTDVQSILLQPGQKWNGVLTLPGIRATNKATLELSRLQPLDLGKHLGYLIHYPYGCVEQTTSSAFPQLYLDGLMDLPAGYKANIETNIKAAINRLRSFQTSQGGFSFWPGSGEENPWGSNYAGHFLLEAEKKGYSVPEALLAQWKKYQKTQAQSWHESNNQDQDLTQSYRLYTLALAGVPELGAMNRLKEVKNLSITARWQLGGAYQLAGQKEVALSLVKGNPQSVKSYQELDGTFGSELRDKAMMLDILTLLGKKTEATPLVQNISDALVKTEWLSTQTTAYALLAMAHYAGASTDKGQTINYGLKFNSKNGDGQFKNILAQQELKINDGVENKVELENRSQGLLYVRLLLEGVPQIGEEKEASNGLQLQIKYMDMHGNSIEPFSLEQGQDFQVEYHVIHAGIGLGPLKQLALASLFPSGWEIRNTRMDAIDNKDSKSTKVNSSTNSNFTYQDFRDTQVNTFFDLAVNEEKVFKFFLNAAYLGVYHLPQSQVEAMYNASINARSASGNVEVKESTGAEGDPNAPSALTKPGQEKSEEN